jgi:MORN repeat
MATPQFVPRPSPPVSEGPPIEPSQQHRRNKSTDTATSSIGMNFNDNQSILTNQSWFGGGGGSILIHPSDNQTVTSNATNLFLQFDSQQQLYYCPHHRYSQGGGQRDNEPPQPIYYKYATDSCPHCEQEFKNHTAYLQQRKKDVMEQLDMYAPSGDGTSPRHASNPSNDPPQTVTMAAPPSQQQPPPAQQQSLYSSVHYGAPVPQQPPSYGPPTVVYHAPPPPQSYHHLHHSAPPPHPPPPPMQFASTQQHLTSYSSPAAPPTDDVARMRHIQDYIFLEKSKECDDMKQRLQQQTELIQQLKIENALLTEKLLQQEMRMQQELKFLKLTAASTKKAAKSAPPQRSLVLVPEPSTRNGRKNRLDQYHHHHPAASRPVPPRPPPSDPYGGDPQHHNNPVVSPLSSPVPYAPHFADDRPADTGFPLLEESYSAGEPPPPHWKLEPSHGVHGEQGSHPLPRPMMDYFDDDIQDDYHKDEDEEEDEEEEDETTNKDRAPQDPSPSAHTAPAALKNHGTSSENGVHGTHSTIPQHFEVDDQAPPVVPLEETISVATFMPPPPPIQRSNDWTEVAATDADGWSSHPPKDATAPPTPNPPVTTAANRLPTTKLAPPPPAMTTAKLPPKSSSTATQPRSPPRHLEHHGTKDISAVSEDEMDAWSYVAAVEESGKDLSGMAHSASSPPPNAATKGSVGVGVNAVAAKEPASKGVTWTDDAASLSGGQSVASSTFGEDRHHVTNQEILDPYGDRGTYSGIILRSTGMPHGSGMMVYQEDHRTYDGEWRHGRWHGHGKATFANGDSYLGEYRFDQRHGRGRYEWNDGRMYDGYVDYFRWEFVRLDLPELILTSEFLCHKMTTSSMFREDKRHGRGNFKWPDGAAYEGYVIYIYLL